MAQYGVPPFWSDIIRAFWSISRLDVDVSDMEALHALLKALGATTVWPLVPDELWKTDQLLA